MSLSNKQIIDLLLQSDLANKKNVLSLMSMSKEILHEDRILSRSVMEKARDISMNECVKGNVGFYDAYTDSLKYLAQDHYDFDAYMLFTEQNREANTRFYLPRRRLIKPLVVDHMQDLMDDKLDLLTVSLPPGTGKAGWVKSKVLTPDGWKYMGDIHVGDTIIGGTGKKCTVLGVYPKGIKKLYKVTMDDGSSTICSDDHLFTVQTRDDRRKGGKYRTIPLSEIMQNVRVENGKRLNYSIDYVPMLDMPEKDFVIHPYVMGALIGNGTLREHGVLFSSADYETVMLVNSLLPEGHILYHKDKYDYRLISTGDGRGRYHKNVVTDKLREYGLTGKHSYEKFIPLPYMYASHEQRKWLLRGLMDTDGYAEAGTSIYTTTSYTLAIQVQELARSLGGYASLTRKTNCGYRDSEGAFVECRDAFNVNMCFPSDKADIYALPRKAERYRPKRKEIKRFIKDVQYVFDDECQCIYVSDPTHLYIADDYILTHNTTIEEMFISFVMGHFPNKPNLFSSFSGFMTRMFYDAVDNFIESNEYCWSDVFPDVKMESTNAKEETINLDRWQPFKTLTCRPINASLTGNTRCENFLCVDDLVSGIEEALSKERMDKLFGKLGTDLRTRRKVGAKEIYLATRWSVHDPIGRLQRLYEGNPRCRFVAIPDIDPTTGRSNFEYDYGVGFTVKYFTDIAATMDEISYRCMFKSEPIEREGILYNMDSLKRYLNLPMDDEGNVLKPDAIFSVCDTKDTGKDYNAHVCIKQYGTKYYLDDVVFKNIDPGALDYLNADMIVRNKVQMSQFESNKEGSRTANEVERIVTEKGWFCHFTKKYTTQNKETKIIINSPWVLEHVYFKDPSLYELQSDYANFIKFLCSWTQLGKNTHDDAPDVMAMVAIFVAEMLGGQVEVMSRQELGF